MCYEIQKYFQYLENDKKKLAGVLKMEAVEIRSNLNLAGHGHLHHVCISWNAGLALLHHTCIIPEGADQKDAAKFAYGASPVCKSELYETDKGRQLVISKMHRDRMVPIKVMTVTPVSSIGL